MKCNRDILYLVCKLVLQLQITGLAVLCLNVLWHMVGLLSWPCQVLKAIQCGDSELFHEHPELLDSIVRVYFHSSSKIYNRMECWGPLRDAMEVILGNTEMSNFTIFLTWVIFTFVFYLCLFVLLSDYVSSCFQGKRGDQLQGLINRDRPPEEWRSPMSTFQALFAILLSNVLLVTWLICLYPDSFLS